MKARLTFALLVVLGCGRTAREPYETPDLGATGGSTNLPDPGVSGSGGVGEQPPMACDTIQAAPAPLAPLKDAELARSVRAVLSEPAPPRDSADTYVGFELDELSVHAVRALHSQAHAIALRVSQAPEQLSALAGCDPLVTAEAACRDQFLERFLSRAFRRPVTEEDRVDMEAVFARGRELGGDFASGARAVIEVALQSPELLYLVELGSGVTRGDSTELTAHELAARLSYLLTGSPPDDELTAIANLDALDPAAQRKQAERLIGSEANRRHVQTSYERWYHLRGGSSSLTAEEVAAAREETWRFIDDVTFDGAGTFEALLTEPATWLNESVARLYGVPNVTGPNFRKVQLDPAWRSGLFTQPTFLFAASRINEPHPVARGIAVLDGLLCQQIPVPPVDAPVPVPGPVPGPTQRARLENETSSPACQTCHRPIHGVGFAFGHYDEVGRFRDTEAGEPVDASGELITGDAEYRVDGAVDLLERIARSEVGQTCFVTRWLEQARRRAATPEDACALAALQRSFTETNGKVTEIMLQLATRQELGLRLNSELNP